MANAIEEKTPFGIVKYEKDELEMWDNTINQQVAVISKNRTEAEQFATDAVQALFFTQKSINSLHNQNIFQRILGSITGGNNKLRDIAQTNLAKAQHNTLKLLQKLGEQDILLMDTILY